ncbi:MAG: hypothetical protein ABIA37_00965 [Candidatus Woesearchaeota archaeon]
MAKTIHKWEVPAEGHFMFKAETVLLGVLVVLVFGFAYATFGSWISTILITLLFIVIFLAVHRLTRKIYPMKEKYEVTSSGISIHSRSGKKSSKVQIKHKDIKRVKLDKFLHGGRIETKKGRHPLYFNTKKEVVKLEKVLKKKLKMS